MGNLHERAPSSSNTFSAQLCNITRILGNPDPQFRAHNPEVGGSRRSFASFRWRAKLARESLPRYQEMKRPVS